MAAEDHGKFRTEFQKHGVHFISTHASAHACALVCALTIARTRAPHTHAHTHAHSQINSKQYGLGYYAVAADAAAARDLVAKVLGYSLNFTKPRKVTGQRSEGADQAVADAVKAANAFVLGNSKKFGFFGKKVTKPRS